MAEFPERAVELTAGLTGAEWAAAWRHAFRQVGSAQGRRLLAWSALRSGTEGDGVVDAIPVGELPDFQSLRQVWDLLENYRTHRSENISEDSDPLSRQGILVRMKRLPGRTPQILADNPFELPAFADLDEIGCSLLASERDQPGKKRARFKDRIDTYLCPSRRQSPGETTSDRTSPTVKGLFSVGGGNGSHSECILSPLARRGLPDTASRVSGMPFARRCGTGTGVLANSLQLCPLRTGRRRRAGARLADPLRSRGYLSCDLSGESELCACFDRALTHLARHTRDKAHLLVTMLRACIWHGPESLIPAAPPRAYKKCLGTEPAGPAVRHTPDFRTKYRAR